MIFKARLITMFLPAISILFFIFCGPGPETTITDNTISAGQEINLSSMLVPGKINIVDFYSEYCPPCVQIAPLLDELSKKREDIEIIKVDINRPDVRGIDWESPVARQFNLRSVPHFIIFGTKGDQISQGEDAFKFVIETLEKENILK